MPRLKRWLIILAILAGLTVSVGGGGTYVALSLTTQPKFCNSCHIMEPYYQSWQSSSHSGVACVDCHYEPGLLETFEGKFKALSQLAKYVTGTEGTKPWAEVSDYSCMRSGCHSERLLEGEIQFGRIRFDHRHHLIHLRRGKKLRCTSCHSQIVQGEHLTVTKSTCILCHFRRSPGSKPIDSCDVCHGPPKEEIHLGDFVFRHSEYLERGVKCVDCHGDITRGAGEVPRERCGSCHNQQAHLDRYGEVEFLHTHHVTEHSVSCLQCHTEIQHSLPPREQHFRGDCKNCHVGLHGEPANVYSGKGGRNVADKPGVMYMARVTCNGCHRAPFPGAPLPPGGTTFKADPLACIDCHGPGYKGMAEHWQAEVESTTGKVRALVEELRELLGEEWEEEADLPAARKHYENAAHNLGMVLLDGSRGVHNLPYARDLLRRAVEDAGLGLRALDPEESPRRIPVGPKVPSEQGCTLLCHVGVEQLAPVEVHGLGFPHGPHLLRARLDCSKCHVADPHGTTTVQLTDCISCHHGQEEATACGKCHTEVGWIWNAEAEGAEMRDLDCLSCHEDVSAGHSREAVKEACDSCHDDKQEGYFEAWRAAALDPLKEVRARLDAAPAGIAAEVLAEVRAELERIEKAGAFHNGAYARKRAKELLERLAK